MIGSAVLRQTFTSLGYKPGNVLSNYRFAAVNLQGAPVRSADAAVFFDEPPSYRNAAIGVVNVPVGQDTALAISERRSLGAPFFIVVDAQGLSAWVLSTDGAVKVASAGAGEWDSFISEHGAKWSAQAVRRAKAVQVRVPSSQQLLFNPAVIYTIQTQVHEALSDLLKRFLEAFEKSGKSLLSLEHDYRVLFPLVFRLLAAKILFDREDKRIAGVSRDDVRAVIEFVSNLYSLPVLGLKWTKPIQSQLHSAWQTLLNGLFVCNIAADDLAFIYENTLISPETRRYFGTHSTPSAVAEYVVRSFDLPAGEALQTLHVYEPFAGSCVFLTAAMRRFKELLPIEWTPATQHRHLIAHFAASELDQFACEIARLSLILADYPNANGWHIHNEDLFDGLALKRRIAQADIVLCNPPFEDFEIDSPSRSTASSVHKPVEVLTGFLTSPPAFLGVVMPHGFSSHKKYRALVDKAFSLYQDIEILTLPENTFAHATVGAVVLVAQKLRAEHDQNPTTLRKASVKRSDFSGFKASLQPSQVEIATLSPLGRPGVNLLDPLREIWEYLADCPRLGEVTHIHRGLEWNMDQRGASSPRPGKGLKPGLHRLKNSLAQFRVLDQVYLEIRDEYLRGGAAQLPWDQPKIICNAIRLTRGPWRLAAAVDTHGLRLSQQFFGMWFQNPLASPHDLDALAAVLNSPLANAYSFTQDPEKGLRVSVMAQLPLPKTLRALALQSLISEYRQLASEDGPLFGGSTSRLSELLMAIDATVLAAYDLPPRLEKALVDFVGSKGRPCNHAFDEYPGAGDPAAIPLATRLAIGHRRVPITSSAWSKILAPLPDDVADVFESA